MKKLVIIFVLGFMTPSAYPLGINHWGTDPRLTSGTQVVFYKTDGTGYIDVQCRTLCKYSDMSAKENIIPLGDEKSQATDTNIAKIEKLKGVNYTWKDDKEKKIQVGFLAQDVENVIHEAIIPYQAEAIKEQQAQIEVLKKLVNK